MTTRNGAIDRSTSLVDGRPFVSAVILCPSSLAEMPELLTLVARRAPTVVPVVASSAEEAQRLVAALAGQGFSVPIPVASTVAELEAALAAIGPGRESGSLRRHMPALLDISRALQARDEQAIYRLLLEAGIEIIGASSGRVFMYDLSLSRLEAVGDYPEQGEPAVDACCGKDLVELACQTDSALLVTRHPHESVGRLTAGEGVGGLGLRVIVDGARTGEELLMPIPAGERTMGVLCLSTRADQPRISANDIEGLHVIVAQVAPALENLHLFARVEQGKKEWEATFDAIEDMVVIVRPDGTIARANQATVRRTGLPFRLLVGQPCCKVVHNADSRPRECPLDAVVRTGQPRSVEITDRPNGRTLQVWAYPMLDSSGNVQSVVEYAKDVTEYKQTLGRLMQSEKLSAIGELTAGVAHELNNPLTSVMGYAQLLQMSREIGPTERGQVERIVHESRRAARIVKNLLTFARRQEPAKVDVDVNRVIQDTIEVTAYQLRVNNIQVTTELGPHVPHTILDPYQLEQVLLNLIANGQHAMREAHDRGTLILRTRVVSRHRGYSDTAGVGYLASEGAQTEPWIRIEVTDDGPGVPPEVISRIFDPFFTTKEVGKGTGLGLSVCHGIIRDHGGQIWVESPPGEGATFIIELPVLSVEAVPHAEPAAPPERPLTAQRRALVVDDEDSNVALLRELLGAQGHSVDSASNGREASRLLSRNRYDLVILDLRMPGMGGDELFREMAQRWPDQAERVIFLTGDMASQRSRSFLQSVQQPVVEKPFQIDELRAAVRRVLEQSRSEE